MDLRISIQVSTYSQMLVADSYSQISPAVARHSLVYPSVARDSQVCSQLFAAKIYADVGSSGQVYPEVATHS